MGEPNGAVSVTNISSRGSDHYSGGQTTGPTGQGEESGIEWREGIQSDAYNRNRDIINKCQNRNSNGISECKLTARTTVPTAPRDRDRETLSLFGNKSTNTTIAGNANGNVGRGRHRLKQRRTATRADQSISLNSVLAAPVVPVSQPKSRSEENSNSAFDNKAFSCDGDSIGAQHNQHNHRFQTQTQSLHRKCLQTNVLSLTTTIINANVDHSTNQCINDQLIHNNDNNSSQITIDSTNSKLKNCFMKTQNDSESTLKEHQYCSSADIRARSSRSARPSRSSVVKHIGVFYSDLCDVFKAMRSGSNSNTNTTNNNNISSSTPSEQTSNATNNRTNISAPVLLQNQHLFNNTVPQPLQPSNATTTPIQPQTQDITCLHSSPQQTHLMSGNTIVRPPQLPIEPPVHDLPDILNAHLPPPPYSTLPPQGIQFPALTSLPPLAPIRAPPPPPPPPPLPAGRPPLPSRRLLHGPSGTLAHCSRQNYLRPTCAVSETETSASKTCLSCNGVSIRWFILLIAFIGLLCAIIGTILGALRTTGREHLTLALLMIGVGIILITVSGIAWRLTSTGPSWRSILGLHELHQQQSLCNGSSINEVSRRFVPRVPAPYGRTGTHHHPYGAMFYPEFQYRPPPPSYQASMQEYRLRLLLLDRTSSHPQSTSLSPVSPPPTYRSSAASSLTGTLPRQSQSNTIQRAPSRPPSYRAMTASDGQTVVSTVPSNQSNTTQPIAHPRTAPAPPVTATMSTTTTSTTSTGVSSTLTTSQTQTQTQSKHLNALKPMTQKPSHQSSHHDINRVTILQTTNTSQVCTPNGVNIVAISPTTIMTANTQTTTTTVPNLTVPSVPSVPVITSNEVQILAHV